jgi:hypothetical protein
MEDQTGAIMHGYVKERLHLVGRTMCDRFILGKES